MAHASRSGLEKANHVRQGRVQVEGGFAHPLGMDVEDARIAQALEGVDRQAPRFGARGPEDAQQLIAKLRLAALSCLEPDEDVNGQATRLEPVGLSV